MACPSVTTLFVATGYRSLWYSETCIKQLLNFVVSQDRWSQWLGEYTWFCKDWPEECRNLCVFSKTIPVLLYRFRCIKSFRSTQKHICRRSGTRGTRASTDTTVVDSVFRIHGYYYISLKPDNARCVDILGWYKWKVENFLSSTVYETCYNSQYTIKLWRTILVTLVELT